MKVTVNAFAKINLLLDIVGRLPNGYHSLYMIMQSVGLYDTVTVERSTGGIECAHPGVPCDGRNIAWKAVAAFEKATGLDCSDTHIIIEKRIPAAAGLAGGSADGAAVLAALNILHGTNLSEQALCRIGATVGADIPFCLTGGTKLAMNIGDVLAPLPDFGGVYIVLAKPDCSVSTKEAYEACDSGENVAHVDLMQLLFDAAKGDWARIFRETCNTFEQFIEVADRVPIKSVMRRHGSDFSMMSGSGPTVYGVFKDKESAEHCAEELRTFVPDVHVCTPVAAGLQISAE